MQDYSFEPYWNLKIHILRAGATIKFAPISGAGDVKFRVLSLDGDYATLVNITPLTSRSSPDDDFYIGSLSKSSPLYVYVGTINKEMQYVTCFKDSAGTGNYGPDTQILKYQATLDSDLLSNMKTNHIVQKGWIKQSSSATDYEFEAYTISDFGYQYEVSRFKSLYRYYDYMEVDRKLCGFDFGWFGSNYGMMPREEFKKYFGLGYKFDENCIHNILLTGSFAMPEDDFGTEMAKTCMSITVESGSSNKFAMPSHNMPQSVNRWTGLMWVVNLKNFTNWSFAD